jgi:thiamine-phosphate pyrophosphorylase
VRAFLSAGIRLIQLRAKTWDSGAFLDLTQASLEDTRVAGAILIVNDRADVAAIAGADGLHVGQDDLPPIDARRVVGESSLVGLSTHTEAQWTLAFDAPISYVAIGPVFGTGTKATGYQPVGLETVRRTSDAAGARDLPVVAIGGITLDRAASVIAAGASSVAVISGLMAGSPEAQARAFMHAVA